MINIQVFQIVAEENSSSVLPVKTAKGLYLADRSWTPQEVGCTGTPACHEDAGTVREAAEVSLEAMKRAVKRV